MRLLLKGGLADTISALPPFLVYMDNIVDKDGNFRFWYPAKLSKGEDGKHYIEGIASTPHEDLQGEKIKQEGLVLDYFLTRGYFNDDHSKETAGKVGIPTEAKITKDGLYTKGFLLETPRAKGIWDLAQALEKSGGDRKLGFSVEGKVLERDTKNPRTITKAWIKDVAITAAPINPNTFLDIVKSTASLKAFVAGATEDEARADKEEQEDRERMKEVDEATKKPTVAQRDVEEKDAIESAKEALDLERKKQSFEKEINDVPIAKRAYQKSFVIEDFGGLETDENGHLVVKAKAVLEAPAQVVAPPRSEPGKVIDNPLEEKPKVGESEDESMKKLQEDADGKPQPMSKEASKNLKKVKKSEEVDLEKGFTIKHSHGGMLDAGGSKKIPIHCTLYQHDSGHHIMVTGNDEAFAVNHMTKLKNGEMKIIGSHIFADDPAKGKKGREEADRHLKGFGIKHRFADKNGLVKKALIKANDSSETCELCKSVIPCGEMYIIQEGKSFCNDACIEQAIEKALVSGYNFAVTDQTGGGALRVESLEGSQKDLSYGQLLNGVKVKKVSFDTDRANGGRTQMTLKDAIDYFGQRGIPENFADRILILMIKNGGDIKKLAKKAIGG